MGRGRQAKARLGIARSNAACGTSGILPRACFVSRQSAVGTNETSPEPKKCGQRVLIQVTNCFVLKHL